MPLRSTAGGLWTAQELKDARFRRGAFALGLGTSLRSPVARGLLTIESAQSSLLGVMRTLLARMRAFFEREYARLDRDGMPLCYWARRGVEDVLREHGLRPEFVLEGAADPDRLDEWSYLRSEFSHRGANFEIFLYEDQVEYFVNGRHGFGREWQDYDSDEEMLADFLKALRAELEGC